MMAEAGFKNIKIQVKENAADIISGWMPGSGAEKYVTSAYVTADKPMFECDKEDVRRKPVYSKEMAAPMEVDSSAPSAAPDVGC